MKVIITREELDREHDLLYLLRRVEQMQEIIRPYHAGTVKIKSSIDLMDFSLAVTPTASDPDNPYTRRVLDEIMQRHLRAALAEMRDTIISRMTVQLAD